MKRVGNDHEPLHNAKLSPTGYYNGFYHKDYQGKYAQVRRHHRRPHHRANVMMRDHKNDSDDILTEDNYIQFDHENDTDDIPADLDPFNMVQTKEEKS
jgi:hypothetical protein